MRTAPPVSVRCSGGWRWRIFQTGLPTLAAAACGVWALHWTQQALGWAAMLAVVVAVLSWRCAAPVPLDLGWDGQRWSANGQLGQLDVMLDVGSALLLRLRPVAGGRPRWMAVTASEAGAAMHGLRVAAYHRLPEPPEPPEPPESREPPALDAPARPAGPARSPVR